MYNITLFSFQTNVLFTLWCIMVKITDDCYLAGAVLSLSPLWFRQPGKIGERGDIKTIEDTRQNYTCHRLWCTVCTAFYGFPSYCMNFGYGALITDSIFSTIIVIGCVILIKIEANNKLIGQLVHHLDETGACVYCKYTLSDMQRRQGREKCFCWKKTKTSTI